MQSNKKLQSLADIQERFLSNRSFLNQYQNIWEKEVLNYYPESLKAFPEEWIAEISSYSLDDLYQLDGKQSFEDLPDGEFKNFVAKCRSLEVLPSTSKSSGPYTSWAWNGVKGKKQHEITRLVPIIKEEMKALHCHQLIDIGGGVGHLARILAHYEGIPVVTVDMNPDLQAKGNKRIKKYPLPEDHNDIQYYCCEFNQDFHQNHLSQLPLKNKSFGMIGLHTCGHLANNFLFNIEKSNSQLGVNLGCCYLKLDPDSQTNLSQLAKQNPLKNTKYSLTLATRGHLKLSKEEFEYKLKVKKYRYLLHLFFLENGLQRFVSVGDSPPRDYAQNFSDYVFLKIEEAYTKKEINQEEYLKLKSRPANEIDKCYQDEKQQETFWNLFYCDLIRWQVGRILEIDILLDRALYAFEKGIEAEVYEVFDENLSPRNIALIYKKKGD